MGPGGGPAGLPQNRELWREPMGSTCSVPAAAGKPCRGGGEQQACGGSRESGGQGGGCWRSYTLLVIFGRLKKPVPF